MGKDAFWDNADLSKEVTTPNLAPYLPKGNYKLKIVSIKSLVNHGEKGRTGKVFIVEIMGSPNEGIKAGEKYQIAYWMHLYGANKIRAMLKDSMDLSQEDLADRDGLTALTDDENSPLIGMTSKVRGFVKDGKDFVNYAWSLFDELK